MRTRFFEFLVRNCVRYAKTVVVTGAVVAVAAGAYVSQNFEMDSNSENLLSAKLSWRQRTIEFDAAFPQRNNLSLVVIDGATPERAQQAATALKAAMATRKDMFPVVRDIQGDPFFAHNGLLFLSLAEAKNTTQSVIKAQPFLAPLAADPSVRGIMDSLSTALTGIENGEGKLEDLTRPFTDISATLEKIVKGETAFLSWQALISGEKAKLSETRRLIEVQPVLDFNRLAPGGPASDLIRKLAADLHLTPADGVTVRLTGPIPLADEEFMTLTDRAVPMAVLMFAAILLMLRLAVRSPKIIAAILITLFAGLAIAMALGLAVIGRFNVISVAFIPLFVGIGVDFGIQYSVRYREERHAHGGLEEALTRAAVVMGPSLTLAAIATAACFYSFVPTDYSGLAELGFIAGSGMIVAFFLSGTMLPALLMLMNPKGEGAAVGFAGLAPVDRFLRGHGRAILIGAGILTATGLALLPSLRFDANPLDLRSRSTESVATLFDLMKNPDTSPNTIEILTPSLMAAEELARRIAMLPEVDKAMTLQSFVPDGQAEKRALIDDAALLMDTTINPFDVKPPPSMEENLASIAATRDALRKAAGDAATPAAQAARRLADVLDMLAKADSATLARVSAALLPGLETMLTQLRAALTPQTADMDALPADLKRNWLTGDGRARVQVFAKGDSSDNDVLKRFSIAVRGVAPDATGAPVTTLESGRTIVNAFIEAGILSLLAMIALLAFALRNVHDVIVTLGPLLAASVLTFATCVVLGLPLNFANIIVLPLLFGIGVAFHIYFIMAWREGTREFLQTSLTRAIFLSALTTATGFGTLWLSRHPGTSSMGELLMISLGWTLLTLFVLPTVLEAARNR